SDPLHPMQVRYRAALRPEILSKQPKLLRWGIPPNHLALKSSAIRRGAKVRLFSIFPYQKQPLSSHLNENPH
ncbi:MAG: hypothetical protein J7527_08175, partial [Chitinophagaceae bacterium]|nr:hypothetical protein [Chitinophagaceae bacterium]